MKTLWKIKMILFVITSVVVLAIVVMWLWNWLVPDLFQGPIISFYQAVGLMLLSRILIRGFHGFNGRGKHNPYWGNWKERLDKMSPEQKEKMRELWKKRCGTFSCEDEKKDEAV